MTEVKMKFIYCFSKMNCIKMSVFFQDPFEWLPRDMLINRGRSSARFVKDAVQAVLAIMFPEASESFNDLRHHFKRQEFQYWYIISQPATLEYRQELFPSVGGTLSHLSVQFCVGSI